MRFSFNLPSRVTKIKITLTEERDNDIVQEKSYTFKRDQFKVFENDHQRSAFINSLIGPEWVNSDDIRMKKKEQRAKRKEAYAARREKRHPWGAGVESIVKELTEGSVVVGVDLNHSDPVPEKGDEGGNGD